MYGSMRAYRRSKMDSVAARSRVSIKIGKGRREAACPFRAGPFRAARLLTAAGVLRTVAETNIMF